MVRHHSTPRKHLIETMAGGLAVFDYDGDGRLDLFFANGASVPSLEKEATDDRNRLYRNVGPMQFVDVTEESGLKGEGFCISADAADYDNDGDPDLFVGGVRKNLLYRNEGGGRFVEVAEESGIRSGDWAADGLWLDFDDDGFLDLLVVNYLQWSAEFDVYCGDKDAGVRSYCHPRLFDGLANVLYRNKGDGTFEDVSASSGIGEHVGKGMSAALGDYDLDGLTDVFVSNDKVPNFLFHNLGGGKFEETGLFVGASLQDHGKPVSSMGADFRDYDDDGNPDIIFTALAGEGFPIFHNAGNDLLEDASYSTDMSRMTRPRSGWGVGMFDFDNDGRKDIFTANSHVNDTVEHFEASKYRLPNSVFQGIAPGKFSDASDESGLSRGPARAHRGAGFGDFDGDGRIDVVVTSLGEPTELWRNVGGEGASWLIIRLVGTVSNRDGIGARVRVDSQWNHMTTSVGYASSSRFGVHFGLGAAERAERIEVYWPSGVVQVIEDVAANQVFEIVEPSK